MVQRHITDTLIFTYFVRLHAYMGAGWLSQYSVWLQTKQWGSIPDRGTGFLLWFLRPDRLWGPPNLCSTGTGGCFPGGKARLGRDADRSPPSSAEVK
jgi:hypothetical protein